MKSHYNHPLLILSLSMQGEPVFYDNYYHIRENNDTTRLSSGKDTLALLQRFASRN